MKLIIVRHGETEDNVAGITQGHRPGKLTSLGLEQSKKLAERLKNKEIDVIFSSDLERAKQTTREITKFHPKVPVHYTKDIRERKLGVLEGRPQKIWLDPKKHNFHLHRPEGGESMVDVRKRAATFLEKLIKNYKNKTVLIISHGGFSRMLLGVLMKKSARDSLGIEQANACVNIVEVSEGHEHKVNLLNCIKHL